LCHVRFLNRKTEPIPALEEISVRSPHRQGKPVHVKLTPMLFPFIEVCRSTMFAHYSQNRSEALIAGQSLSFVLERYLAGEIMLS
jgi:hypothetical protein